MQVFILGDFLPKGQLFPNHYLLIFFQNIKKFFFSQLPENSRDISRRSNLDRYIDRPDRPFYQGKYRILVSLCFAGFVAYYSPIYIQKDDEMGTEYQPDSLQDNLLESNHTSCQ